MIDVPAHDVPDGDRAALLHHGHDQPDGFPQIPMWSAEEHVAAMAEIAYWCDRVDVAGFAVLTNVGGTYLGDPAYAPVFRELDRRGVPRPWPPSDSTSNSVV